MSTQTKRSGNAKDEIFARIRKALVDVEESDAKDYPVEWQYAQPTPFDDVIGVFLERVEDYKAVVERVPAKKIPALIVEHLQGMEVKSVVLPSGIDQSWRDAIESSGIEIRSDEPPLTNLELNETEAVVTAAAVGIAETGTFVMDHRADQGRRALTLVPDRHICVVRADQVVTNVPEATARLKQSILDGQPLTWVSGPSATSDIELSRVEGVHGPRILHVFVAE